MSKESLCSAVLRAHDALWGRFYRAESRLFYEREFTDDGDFPTDREIAGCVPNTTGWATGMEDCCLNGGWILDGLLCAHAATKDASWAAKAREVFLGLARLGSLAPLRGFIVRGTAPSRDDYYPNSSADQATSFVCAMVRYAASPVARLVEREMARDLVERVARLVEGFHDDLPTADGKPSIYGDTSTMHPGRACRLLLIYKAAHALTGENHWADAYRARATAGDGARPRCHFPSEPVAREQNLHAHFQSQAAFRVLFDIESNAALKACYGKALDATATAVLAWAGGWGGWRFDEAGPDLSWRECWRRFLEENPGPHAHDLQGQMPFVRFQRLLTPGICHDLAELRRPVEAFAICMMAENPALRAAAAQRVGPVDFGKVRISTAIACLEGAYWRGVTSGLFPAH